MAAAEPSPSAPPPPDFRRRQRRLVFDRRYGWIFDEWTDPGVDALSGGRGTFCILPMAQLLMNAAASSVNYAADSVSTALKRPGNFSPVAYLPHQVLHRRRHQTWCRELEQSGVIADVKLVPCRTHCTLECLCNNRD
ncbi:uncharacterized protein LOC100834430 isoform X2 [Brachypodium distachyon]|uniref:Uncharacterized protein n=1 Tax=Brachypodium distachyon TaxID=15368 RepID=I1H2A8_BRADI|nr:uncharacterized protein LOC100834430 isoform X2 [Brachypodium distachyon]KQK20185.1 hypothetical protein BRADI_1g53027v3 [Brachypodium distachyon]|eukprot:XP_003557315.1 uncharacterized protein LOC100834430 isoform X2 [Brachypodium distachyon]